MKNILKLLSVLLIMVVLTAAVTSCGSDEDKIVGKWTAQQSILGFVTETTYVFNKDGTGTVDGLMDVTLALNYTMDGGKITITTEVLGVQSSQTYQYALKGDTLTLTQGSESVAYTKAK